MKLPIGVLPPQELFVGMGCLLMASLALWRGRRRGVEEWVVVAAVGLCGVGAVLGARILWAGVGGPGASGLADSWAMWVDPRYGGFASLGGVAGGGLVLAGLRTRLPTERFWRLADVLVPAGLLGLAVARLGCLSAGCDFGAVAELPWSVRYPADAPAWRVHLEAGLLGAGAEWSRPVHPFPLYDIGVILLAAALGQVVSVRAGLGAAVTGVAYLSGRVAVEEFRGPQEAVVAAGLNVHQLFALSMLPILFWCVWIRYRD